MRVFGLSHRMQVVAVLFAVVVVFCVWAKIDFAVTGLNGNYLAEENLGAYWFWMWDVGVIVTGFVLALSYYAGASDTERNEVYAVGIFLTVIVLLLGQFEDFLYFVLNGVPFPSGDWTWMPLYGVLGTWTTGMHFVTLFCSFVAVAVLWYFIFEVYEP
ncbi:MAG: hypothetical protein NWF06_10380 [Candidatus Bathyarchaeota archaeon]|nr:hypothetical protein [Candidatus Bathyarchaeum sp.]